MSTFTYGECFAGIGGMSLGLERSGMTPRWFIEIDPFCRRVLAKHWPGVPRYGDIREIGGEELERVDLICGGFPCQDISDAGKRAGIDGERSGLWSEYARLIRVLRPRYVLVENVAALLHRGLGRVLGDLAESGYDAEWDCIPAAAVGAPHLRDRVFVVAYPAGNGWGEGQRVPAEGRLDGAHPRRRRAHVSHSERARLEGRSGEGQPISRRSPVVFACDPEGPRGKWLPEPVLGRVAPRSTDLVDRLTALGNAVVPQVAEYVGRRILAAASPSVASGARREA